MILSFEFLIFSWNLQSGLSNSKLKIQN